MKTYDYLSMINVKDKDAHAADGVIMMPIDSKISTKSNGDANTNTGIAINKLLSTINKSNDVKSKKNTDLVATRMKNEILKNMAKEKMVDIIFEQNSVIAQQSKHISEQSKKIGNVVNNVSDNIDKINKINKIDRISISSRDKLQRNIDILKNRNNLCKEASALRQESTKIFESTVRIQFVLFTLFIVVLLWLLYNYMSYESSAT